jgi:cation diffusion facilitator CzcD-associated flavoprotein CzcO
MTPATDHSREDPRTPRHHRVAIIGTGFSGLGAAIALEKEGVDYVVLERAGDVGGTWRDNTYPGCQCDVPSHLYSFSFAPNPDWSRTYSPQPEIWDYLRRTTDAYGVRDRIRFSTDVREAWWDASNNVWTIETNNGTYTANVLIGANGALSEPSVPEIAGLEDFTGTVFHSAQWAHGHDLAGERVAVIGTGASAIQFVPKIQSKVAKLTLFQRTPAWVLPHTDRPVSHIERVLYRRFPVAQRLARAFVYWMRELVVIAMTRNPKLTKPIERLARMNLTRHVKDPVLRAKLTPTFSAGCKRLLLSDDFYPALVQPNVTVETSSIAEIRDRSIVTDDGNEHDVDTIIFGTGFHVTDNPIAERIRGRDGLTLAKAYSDDGARAYLGTTAPGFPNFFQMTGPNTGIGHTSLVVMIEAQLTYILDALRTMERAGVETIEVERAPFERYNDELQSRMGRTVWNAGGCASWYLDSHGRNTTLWPDFTWKYRLAMRRFDSENYAVTTRRAS